MQLIYDTAISLLAQGSPFFVQSNNRNALLRWIVGRRCRETCEIGERIGYCHTLGQGGSIGGREYPPTQPFLSSSWLLFPALTKCHHPFGTLPPQCCCQRRSELFWMSRTHSQVLESPYRKRSMIWLKTTGRWHSWAGKLGFFQNSYNLPGKNSKINRCLWFWLFVNLITPPVGTP